MADPDDDTQLKAVDDTVISSVNPLEDTVIGVPDDATIVGTTSPDDTSVELDATIVSAEDTVISVAENTSLSVDEDTTTTKVISEIPVSATEVNPPVSSSAYLVDIHGGMYSLNLPVIFGRMPAAPRSASAGVRLVVVSSPTGVVSGTHAKVEAVGATVVVTDLHSSNGTRVQMTGQPEMLLGPGESVTVGTGAKIDIGDGNRLEVLS
jgi:hypothetical protein